MNKETIKQAIVEFQEDNLPSIIPRDTTIPLESDKIIAITGVRRSGKTYLIFSLIKELIESGISRDRIVYINFDDPRLLPAFTGDLELILEAYWEIYPGNQDSINYLFLDEIQHVRNWELGVRRIYDTKKFRIILTGSSSKFLSRDIATSLRGRSVNFEIIPFSLQEFLRAKNVRIDKLSPYSKVRYQAKKYLEDYFICGGFPEIVLQQDPGMKIRILREYVETMYLKDLIERYRIKNQVVMREFLKFLISNASNLFSLNAFWKWMKNAYPVTKRTLIYYLSYIEDSGIIYLVKKFSYTLKEQNLRPRKVYIVDNGLRKAYGFEFSQDKGKIIENSAYLALRHFQIKSPLVEIYYWRDGKGREVDFIVKDGREVKQLIQVCSNPQEFGAKKREILPLVKAMEEFNMKDSLVITEDFEDEEKIEGKKIRYIPLWKWILTERI